MRVLILTGGYIDDDFAELYIKNYRPHYIIAADRGMEFCRRRGIVPDCIVGDFDSANEETVAYFHQIPQIIWKQFCPKKDETDTELALMTAFEHQASEIHLVGATGTRLDHVLGNIRLLQKALMRDIPAYIIDTNNRISLTDGVKKIEKKEQYGKYVSILPFGTTVKNITLKGLLYPLEHARLYNDNTLGISNEITEDTAVIELEEGIVIVIESKD